MFARGAGLVARAGVCALLLFVASMAVWVGACANTGSNSPFDANAAGRWEATPAAAPGEAAKRGWTPVGGSQGSSGLTDSLTAFREHTDEQGALRQVPGNDLYSMIGQAEGGSGRSPFDQSVEEASPAVTSFNGWSAETPAARGSAGRDPYAHARMTQGDDAEVGRPAPAPEPVLLPPSFALRPGDELWVIERRAKPDLDGSRLDERPGSGCLMTEREENSQRRQVAVPLESTDVHASITGIIASVDVTQRFANPFGEKIEAVYVFPLPDDAAVSDFVMTIGGRSIRGVIREREQAQRIYNEAKQQGYHAALMSQERSNIFTQRVANIEPGRTIDVTMTYFNTLGYRGGSEGGSSEGCFEFTFPMTIGPRYNPPGTRDAIRAVSADAQWNSSTTNVVYARPGVRGGRDIHLTVDMNGGLPIQWLECPSHDVRIDMGAPASPGERPMSATITLGQNDTIPNRDFVLRYRLMGDQTRAGLMTYTDPQGQGYFTMMLAPPQDLRYTRRGPVEFVFVVDCSGSMAGQPLALCKAAVCRALEQLRPGDTFQVVRFSDTCTTMASRAVAADERNIRDGIDYVRGLQTGGGTEMKKGLREALKADGDWKRSRFVWFLTDGFIGNDAEVLASLKDWLGDSRVFSVGVGSAPNRTLMNAMARLGKGASAYIAGEDDAREMTDLFVQRVTSAAMTNVKIDWGNWVVSDVFPRTGDLPDLYVDRPVMLVGRFTARGGRADRAPSVSISGRVGDERVTIPAWHCEVPARARQAADGSAGATTMPALAQVWARTKIQSLDDRAPTSGSGARASEDSWNSKRDEIRRVALSFGLVSAYTSFVAVDSMDRTGRDDGRGVTVNVPSELPRGTRYDTTVER